VSSAIRCTTIAGVGERRLAPKGAVPTLLPNQREVGDGQETEQV
jgi:hypothetical protein